MSRSTSIGIIGAGLSGLVLGRALKARGLSVVLFERQTSRTASYSITLSPSTYDSLKNLLGLDSGSFLQLVVSNELTTQENNSDSLRVNRGLLEQRLQEGLDIRWEHDLINTHRMEDKIRLTFKSGPPFDTHLAIGCDGAMSNFRRLLAPNSPLQVHEYVVFNGKTRLKREEFELIAEHFRDVNGVQSQVGDVLLRGYLNESVSLSSQDVSLSYRYSRRPTGPEDRCYKPDRPASDSKKYDDEFWTDLAPRRKYLREPFRTILQKIPAERHHIRHWLMRSGMVSRNRLEEALNMNGVMIGDSLHTTPILGSSGADMAVQDGLELATCIAKGGNLKENLRCFYQKGCERWQGFVGEGLKILADMHPSRL